MRVHAVLPAPHLLLYLNDPHVAIPFAPRLCVTDQFCPLGVGAQAWDLHAEARGLDIWSWHEIHGNGTGRQAWAARAGPSGCTVFRRAKMMIRW
ncbi:MAG: hypothetical protein ACXVRP_00770, partial [Solirubrobacteraceae bacterium]